jgi:hypothetical protein
MSMYSTVYALQLARELCSYVLAREQDTVHSAVPYSGCSMLASSTHSYVESSELASEHHSVQY